MRPVITMLTLSFMALVHVIRGEAKEPAATDIPTALQEYVAAKDDVFAWTIRGKEEKNGCLVYDIDLTSQEWQGITWKHAMSAFVPEGVRHTDIVLLFIMGGSTGNRPGDGDLEMGAKLATLAQMPVAMLYQVPNQPLLGNKKEDDLISETFLRYLATKDAKWPLLFPMAKSAVKAMDALQQIAQQEHGATVERFVVTGGSKRGWTTWLSAVVDKRVAGIAPIVIDTLNMRPQMKHQMETWGAYSEQIADYTSKGLVDVMDKNPELPLWRWVDPYTYRSQLKLPKLLINGTNDRYWVIDALNLYWDDLVGPKHVFYVPNAGHGLDGGKEAALTTLAAFAQNVAMDQPMPALTWLHDDDGNQMRLSVRSDPAPKAVKMWVARSDDKDFRPDRWNATELSANGDGAYVGQVEKPTTGHVAFFGEATYEFGPVEYGLSTQIRQE
jgi:PhoPQ-activated pathogenicity-related protein